MKMKLLLITALSTFAFSLNACPKPSATTLTQQYETGALQWQIARKEIDPHTLIHKAILENSPEVIRFLLAQGVDVDYPDKNGMTPLTIALLNRSLCAVQVLIANGANPNPGAKWNEMTLLELAIKMDDPISTKLLIEHGADLNVRCQDMSALYKVMNSKWKEIAILMINKGADINSNGIDSPLMEAVHLAHSGDRSFLELLLKKGANINQIQIHDGKEINTPLLQAVFSGNLSLVKFLVESGADVNKAICYYGYEVRSPLKHALANGRVELVQYLLQYAYRG